MNSVELVGLIFKLCHCIKTKLTRQVRIYNLGFLKENNCSSKTSYLLLG